MATPLRRLRIRADFGHGRKAQNAGQWLDALELRYAEHKAHTGRTLAAMSHASDNEGRSYADADRNLVNGMEVRFSERWLIPTDPTVDYSTVTSILPDGSRKPFTAHLDAQLDDLASRKPAPKPVPAIRMRKTYL